MTAILHQAGLRRPYRDSRPITLEPAELADPGRDEVLVRIVGAGVCHSDLSAINGDRERPLPLALGHEASGVVEAVGPGVDDLAPGAHVVMSFLPVCGTCEACAEGRASLCAPGHAANIGGTLLTGARRITCDDVPMNHHCGVSAFSTYAVVARRSVVSVTDAIPLELAALFGCAVMTGVGTIVNSCRPRPGESVAVVGLGGVGLSAVLGAVAAGAGRVVAVDVNPDKLRLAESLGATDTFDAREPDVVRLLRERTGGGVHHAVEMAGAARAFETAFAITRRGGTTTSAGLANPRTPFAIGPVPLVAEERTVRGSFMGGCVPARDIPRFIDLFLRGRLPVDRLLSSTGPLDGINEAFDRLDRGEVVRHVIDMRLAAA